MSIGAVDETPESVDPNAVDAISGQLPPALQPPPPIPGGNLTPEQLAAAATVPLNPGASPLDAELAKLPASLPPAAPPPKTPVEAAARNVEEAAKIGEEKTVNAEEKAALDTKTAIARQTFLKDHGEAFQKVLDAQEQHRQAAEQAVTVARNKAETEPYHTLFETRSTAQKVAIALSLLVGGVSWNENHVNRGAQMLEAATKADFETQKLKHADLWRAVNEAQQGAKDLDAKQLRDLSAFNMSQGAKWDRISSELGALIAANKGKSDVSEAKSQALKANETANTFFQNATSAAATARHLEAMDAERILHDRETEKAKAKKAAAAGGGSSSAAQAAAVTLREDIEKAQAAGKPLTGAQIDRRALELKIPPVAKAGRVSVKTVLDSIKEGAAIKTADDKANELTIKHDTADSKLEIRDETGIRGYVTSPKDVAKFNKDRINYKQAISSLEEMAKQLRGGLISGYDIPKGSRWDNAVLAIASTTTAGSTDANVKHEAGTLLNKAGAVDITAVEEKLRDLRSRQKDFYSTLRPVKAGTPGISPLAKVEKGAGSEGKWIAVPPSLQGNAKLKGKTEVQVNASGDVIGAR